MTKRLTKYDPNQEQAKAFHIAVKDWVTGECANIDFDNLVEAGMIVPYSPDGKKAFKVFV